MRIHAPKLLMTHRVGFEPTNIGINNSGEDWQGALNIYIQSRTKGISHNTIRDCMNTLNKSLPVLLLSPMPSGINHFLASLTCSLGGKYDYSKLMRAFYNWLYTPGSGLPFYS